MTIEPAGPADGGEVARLLGQLSPGREPPSPAELAEILAAAGTELLLARDGGRVAGMLTLVLFRTPTGLHGRIEDVVVDEPARGRGIGAALTEEALRRAAAAGVDAVELTSRPSREPANRLYARLGFERRETNVYVWRPG
ncbi:MAG TPA: GNAT family N-acetyltransferase [Gaiellaceae bacterium]|nr:GNAT family N-acetyltransferase [Gaiellaceae bacterium]